MLGEAIGAEVKLVDAAHHCRRFNPAQVAAATSLRLGLRIGGYRCLSRTSSEIDPACADQCPQRETADSYAGDRFVLPLGRSGSKESEAEQHQQAPYNDQYQTELPAHEDTFLRD